MKLYNVFLLYWKRTFGDDALDADQVAEKPGRQSSRSDVLGAKASLESYKKLFVFFAVSWVNGFNILLKRILKSQLFLERITQQARFAERFYRDKFHRIVLELWKL